MTQEIIQGLHSCKKENAPVIGEIKTFVIEQKVGKSGKQYLKIKSASVEHGGTPYRILEAEPTGFTDSYGNISFNLGIEPATSTQPLQEQWPAGTKLPPGLPHQDAPQHAFRPAQGLPPPKLDLDGVQETREHLMRSANLLVLCIRAVEKAVAPHQPVVAQTSEQFQSDVAKLFIEASKRITNDGVTWWSYVDKMPVKPLSQTKNGGIEQSENLRRLEQAEGIYQPEPF